MSTDGRTPLGHVAPVTQSTSSDPGTGFASRITAGSIDIAVLCILTGIVGLLLSIVNRDVAFDQELPRALFGVFSTVWILRVVMDATWIPTPGRFFTVTRVVHARTGRNLGIARALLRNSWSLAAFATLYLSPSGLYLTLGIVLLQCVSQLASPSSQTLTDALAGAQVVPYGRL